MKHETLATPLLRVAASGATGVLVGGLIGLSASPAAATFVGGLTGLLVAFLGSETPTRLAQGLLESRRGRSREARQADNTDNFDSSNEQAKPPGPTARPASVLAFSLAALASTVVGVEARSRGWLGPSYKMRVLALTNAGFSSTEARRYILQQDLGTYGESHEEPHKQEGAGESGNAGPQRIAGSKLPPPGILSASETSSCAELGAKKFSDPHQAVTAYLNEDPPFSYFAPIAMSVPMDKRIELLRRMTEAICGPQ